MGISLDVVDYDHMLRSLSQPPIVLNDLPSVTVQDKQRINALTISTYENADVFSNIPSCECGETKGGYELRVICPECRTPVVEPFEQGLEHRVWFRAPKGVDALINPHVYWMLLKSFPSNKGGFKIIDWLINTDYVPTVEPHREAEELRATYGRGLNTFIRNFDAIFDALCQMSHYTKTKALKVRKAQLKDFVNAYRDRLFPKMLPLPNKMMMILEDTHLATWVDPIIVNVIDAIRTMTSIDTELSNLTLSQRQNRTAKTIIKYGLYNHDVQRTHLAKKSGLFRKHAFGSRMNWSTRAVISSNTDPHKYDEIHLAWSHGVTMMGLHLKNKLINQHNYTPNEAAAFLKEYTVKYHSLLDQLFQELINESPDKKLYAIDVRYPSMGRGSNQRLGISKIKTDVNDPTISHPILNVKPYNAD